MDLKQLSLVSFFWSWYDLSCSLAVFSPVGINSDQNICCKIPVCHIWWSLNVSCEMLQFHSSICIVFPNNLHNNLQTRLHHPLCCYHTGLHKLLLDQHCWIHAHERTRQTKHTSTAGKMCRFDSWNSEFLYCCCIGRLCSEQSASDAMKKIKQ